MQLLDRKPNVNKNFDFEVITVMVDSYIIICNKFHCSPSNCHQDLSFEYFDLIIIHPKLKIDILVWTKVVDRETD